MIDKRLKTLGINIKSARLKKSISQEELAELVGISLASMSLIETGKQNTAALNLIDIAKILDVNLDILTNDV